MKAAPKPKTEKTAKQAFIELVIDELNNAVLPAHVERVLFWEGSSDKGDILGIRAVRKIIYKVLNSDGFTPRECKEEERVTEMFSIDIGPEAEFRGDLDKINRRNMWNGYGVKYFYTDDIEKILKKVFAPVVS